MNFNFLVLAQAFLFIAAVVYRIIAWSKKDQESDRHYTILSEVYIAALVIVIGLSHQSKCNTPVEVITIHDTILTHGPSATEVIPAHNPHWNDVPETTFKK